MGDRSSSLELRSCKESNEGTFTHCSVETRLTRIAKAIYQQEPDLTREGGSIPVTLTFADSLGVNVLLLPMGRGDDGAQ